jgi:signal transduction histidine kinase
MNWCKIRLSLLVFFFIVLVLQLPATLLVNGEITVDFISIARIMQIIMLVIFSFLSFKFPQKNYLNIFLIISIIIQLIAAIKFEPKNELVAYNFIAILVIISAVTFRENLKEWFVFNFPIHFTALVLPIFFKNSALHSTVGIFFNNFLFGIFSLITSIIVVSIYSTREHFSAKLAHELNQQEKKLKEEFEKIQKMKVQLEIGNLASQVAHDIRSPLAALENLTMSALADSVEQKIAKVAIKRLQGIANTLLEKGRFTNASIVGPTEISSIIKCIIDTKSVEFPKRQIISKGIKKEFFAKVDKTKFESILSNLINNALEASAESSPVVINYFINNKYIVIEITDHGKGIPSEVLSKLGLEKISFDKKDGNGLGVFSSFQAIKEWGGTLKIDSKLNIGSTITISLPLIPDESTNNVHVLLDNDELVRITWESKAKKTGVKLLTFATSLELFLSVSQFSIKTIFYIDSELDNEKGEEVALKLFNMGYLNLIMCSGYSEEKFSHLNFIKKTIGKTPPFAS